MPWALQTGMFLCYVEVKDSRVSASSLDFTCIVFLGRRNSTAPSKKQISRKMDPILALNP